MENMVEQKRKIIAIASFQDVMLPLHIECNDGKEHNGKELAEILSKKFKLSDEEKNFKFE